MDIYLDIDGVLLANELTPANHADEFLRMVLAKFPTTTYWLSTHCNGDASVPIEHIGHLFPPDIRELMRHIKPTRWEGSKTRAIDFYRPFLWFDDDLFYEEQKALEKHGVLDNWIEVNLNRNPDQLSDFIRSFPVPVVPQRSPR